MPPWETAKFLVQSSSQWTGVFQFILHKKEDIPANTLLSGLNWPLLRIETSQKAQRGVHLVDLLPISTSGERRR
jgi:hypothetical protein